MRNQAFKRYDVDRNVDMPRPDQKQKVIKKHLASMAEINNHEPRIYAVSGTAQNMMEEGHFASEDIKPNAKILKPRLKL